MTRKPGRPPLHPDAATIRRHSAGKDDEMMKIETVVVTKSALDSLRDERNEISRDYRKLADEAETLRRQRDELLQALRTISETGNVSQIDELLAKYTEIAQ